MASLILAIVLCLAVMFAVNMWSTWREGRVWYACLPARQLAMWRCAGRWAANTRVQAGLKGTHRPYRPLALALRGAGSSGGGR